jgi:Holliday junction resolvasome RuvABC endonuclease subunit
MRKLCCDPGLGGTGIAVTDADELLYHYSLAPDPKLDVTTRIYLIATAVGVTCETREPQLARVELLHSGIRRGTVARNLNTTDLFKLARLTGAIEYELKRRGLPVEMVPPSTMRFMGEPVRREVKKAIACQIMLTRYGIKMDDHVADAVLLGIPATTAEIAKAWMEVQPACVQKAQKRAQRRIAKGGR